MIGYLVCCFVGSFVGMIIMALVSAGKYDDQQRYFAKERKKWVEENQRLKRKNANYEWLWKRIARAKKYENPIKEAFNLPGDEVKIKWGLFSRIMNDGRTKVNEIETITFEEAIKVLKKGDAKAVIISKEDIKVVDLPEYGIAGLRMVAGRLDRVEYSYTKK